jgi:hypothetical protein
MRHPGGVRGSRTALVVLWVTLAAVVVVSGWIGVHLVGQALAPMATPVLSGSDMDALLAKAQPKLTPTPDSSGRHGGNGDGDQDHDDNGNQSPEPSSSPGGDKSTQPSAGGSPGTDVTSVYRTFRSRGGSAVVSCTGTRISLESWSPAVGYRTQEKQVERSELEVSFEGSSGSSKIHASCQSGTPVAEVDSEVDSEDDSGDASDD